MTSTPPAASSTYSQNTNGQNAGEAHVPSFAPFMSASQAFLGAHAMDESLRALSDMVYRALPSDASTDPNVKIELEGKIGKIIAKGGGASGPGMSAQNRLQLPFVRSECVIDPTRSLDSHQYLEFQSTLDADTFRRLNEKINHQFQKLQKMQREQAYHGYLIQYARTKEVDQYVKDPIASKGSVGKDSRLLRVSLDTATREPKYAMQKRRLGNLDIYCPHADWDYRISVSEERKMQVPDMRTAVVDHEREKDRLSYSFGNLWRLDLTTVITRNMDAFGKPKPGDSKTTFEVELECDGDALLGEKLKMTRRQPSQFDVHTKVMLEHMRALVLQANRPPPSQQAPHQPQPQAASRQATPMQHQAQQVPPQQHLAAASGTAGLPQQQQQQDLPQAKKRKLNE